MKTFLIQILFLGNLILTSDADPVLQIQNFTLFPLHRYGMPVIDNSGGQAMHSDAIECFVALTPLIDGEEEIVLPSRSEASTVVDRPWYSRLQCQ